MKQSVKQMLQMLPDYCLVGLITFGTMVKGTYTHLNVLMGPVTIAVRSAHHTCTKAQQASCCVGCTVMVTFWCITINHRCLPFTMPFQS